jgi:hypothetical protein
MVVPEYRAMKFNVFGRVMEVVRDGKHWKVYYPGNEGKKRIAENIHIPSEVAECDLVEYLADICHEWARPDRSDVRRLD